MNYGCPYVRRIANGIQQDREIFRNYADNDDACEFAMRPGDSAKKTEHECVKNCLERGTHVKDGWIGVLDGSLEIFPIGEVHAD